MEKSMICGGEGMYLERMSLQMAKRVVRVLVEVEIRVWWVWELGLWTVEEREKLI